MTRRLLIVLVIGSLVTGCGSGAAVSPTTATPPASEAPSAQSVQTPASPGMPSATSTPTVTVAPTAVPTPTTTPASTAQKWDAPANVKLDAALASALTAKLASWVGTNGIPGVAAAVVTPKGSWAGAAGVDAAGRKIEPDSAFAIESMTKTFTAAEVLLLASRGKIDLDAPVTRYVELPFDAHGATIRQLATMTSGFPGFPSDATLQAMVAKEPQRVWTAAEMVGLAKDQPAVGTLGGPSAYNGVAYDVLGMVIEKVTGQSLAAALRRDLIEPAGLGRVWVQPDEKPKAPLTVAVVPSANIVDPKSGFLPSLAAASMGRGGAAIAGDAPSLARWGYLLFGGRVIDPSLVATMTSGDPNSGDGYGFGTMLSDWGGTFVVGHAGDWMGYSSIVLVYPDTRASIVVLAPKEGMTLDGTVGGWAVDLDGVIRGAG